MGRNYRSSSNSRADFTRFKKKFITKCNITFQSFKYGNTNEKSKCQTFIDWYVERYRVRHVTDKVILHALEHAKARLLRKLPRKLQKIAHSLAEISGNKGMVSLHRLSMTDMEKYQKYIDDIIMIRLISNEIRNSVATTKLPDTIHKYFRSDVTDVEIRRWKWNIGSVVYPSDSSGRHLKFRNQWFAIYFAMLQDLRQESMHEFVKLMNEEEWFSQCPVPCSYDAISDYHFLLDAPIEDWLKPEILPKTKATMKGILRIKEFLSKIPPKN